jgi:hypothetical protein
MGLFRMWRRFVSIEVIFQYVENEGKVMDTQFGGICGTLTNANDPES